MFANKQESVDALLVKETETNLYLLIRNGHNPLPQKYEVVKSLQDVPKSIVSLLDFPRPLEENLHILLEEEEKTNKYRNKISDYEKTVIEILESSKR
jgi:hypothetical protein